VGQLQGPGPRRAAKLGIPLTYSDLFGAWGDMWLDQLALPQPYAGKTASLR
jgi:hypothetical protein